MITTASYNISWANSAGLFADNVYTSKPIPSEHVFIGRAKVPLEFWNNVVEHISHFVVEKKPSFIGFQEAGRVDDIISLPALADYHHHVNRQKHAVLLTMWHKDLGELAHVEDADMGEHFDEYSGRKDLGRPLTAVTTTNGFLLINLHSPYGERPEFTAWQERTIAPYVRGDPAKVFIVGDFNNPQFSNRVPLRLPNARLTPGNDAIVASCCHTERAFALHKYIRGGDYCFGLNVVHPLTVFPSPTDDVGASVASDHELVWATFTTGAKGGRRTTRKTRKTQKRRQQKRAHK